MKDGDTDKRPSRIKRPIQRKQKIKYIYTNENYTEEEVRLTWEQGWVDISKVELKNVNKELYSDIDRNGKLLFARKEKRPTTRSQRNQNQYK